MLRKLDGNFQEKKGLEEGDFFCVEEKTVSKTLQFDGNCAGAARHVR